MENAFQNMGNWKCTLKAFQFKSSGKKIQHNNNDSLFTSHFNLETFEKLKMLQYIRKCILHCQEICVGGKVTGTVYVIDGESRDYNVMNRKHLILFKKIQHNFWWFCEVFQLQCKHQKFKTCDFFRLHKQLDKIC